jgi:PKD repeat protein
LFVTSVGDRPVIEIIKSSTNNQVTNNVLVTVTINGSTVSANADGQLLETDGSTVNANRFEHNAWISGHCISLDTGSAYAPAATELRQANFEPSWFAAFPTALGHDPAAFAPTPSAPWLNLGAALSAVPKDRDGAARHAPVDLGPFER